MSKLHGSNGNKTPGHSTDAATPVIETGHHSTGGEQVIYGYDIGVVPGVASFPVRRERRRGTMIGIDIDDCIAGYVQGLVQEYGWPETFERQSAATIIRTNWPEFDVDAHLEDKSHIQFCKNLLPIDGAFSACEILLKHGFPISYISRRNPSHKDMTAEWLSTWGFPTAPIYCVGSSNGKALVWANLDIVAVVEDSPEDILRARDDGIATFIMDRPWNREIPGLYRCLGWTHILETIDKNWMPIRG